MAYTIYNSDIVEVFPEHVFLALNWSNGRFYWQMLYIYPWQREARICSMEQKQ